MVFGAQYMICRAS